MECGSAGDGDDEVALRDHFVEGVLTDFELIAGGESGDEIVDDGMGGGGGGEEEFYLGESLTDRLGDLEHAREVFEGF